MEQLRSQGLEKDQANKALAEKLEALVRCRAPRWGQVGQGWGQDWHIRGHKLRPVWLGWDMTPQHGLSPKAGRLRG